MALDPQVAAYLEQAAALGLPSPSEVPLAQARREYAQAAPMLFGESAQLWSVEDVDVLGTPIRVYRPAPGGLPGLVYLHGGGWVLGGLESHDPLCRALAARSGWAVIAVGYRLAPEHPYPAAAEDAWMVTEWAAERFAPLAVAGDSAGGQLAAVAALRARDFGIRLTQQVLIYPATDYAFDTPSYRENAEGMVLTAQLMRWFWTQYVQDPRRADERDCSPLRVPDLAGVAPALVVTAEYDPLRDDGEAYARRLQNAGVPAALSRYEGQIHGFVRMPAFIDRADDAIDEVADALRAAVAEPTERRS